MAVPILYRISRVLVRTALRGYFRDIEITGAANIPPDGPVILAANHPHSITDALVLGLGAGRMLHFIAHSGLFKARWKAWFLRGSGVIPVYRSTEVADAAEANAAMFSACFEVLQQGGAIGIFPEGTSAEERRVQALKTGTARIALGAEDAAGWDLGVKIVPVGLNFESCTRFRSRVLVKFGEALAADAYREPYAADPVETARALTAQLQASLRGQVVNVQQSEYEQFVRDVDTVYKGELLDRDDVTIRGKSSFQRDQAVTREIARALDYFYENSPDIIWRLAHDVRRYHTMRRLLKLRDEMLRQEEGPGVRRELWRFVVMGLAGLPWALIGVVGNWLPYKLTGWLTGRLAPDRTKVHAFQMGLGAVLFTLWYGMLLYLAAGRFGAWGAVVTGLALPPAGLFARGYSRYMRKRRGMIRFAGLEMLQGLRIQELRLRRRRLIRSLDGALAEYLAAQEESP